MKIEIDFENGLKRKYEIDNKVKEAILKGHLCHIEMDIKYPNYAEYMHITIKNEEEC